jgi:hypothetical protein
MGFFISLAAYQAINTIWVVRQEAELVRSFVMQPRGIFETVDEAIKIIRSNIQQLRNSGMFTLMDGKAVAKLLRG